MSYRKLPSRYQFTQIREIFESGRHQWPGLIALSDSNVDKEIKVRINRGELDVNKTDNEDVTPLMLAVQHRYNNSDLVSFLVKKVLRSTVPINMEILLFIMLLNMVKTTILIMLKF